MRICDIVIPIWNQKKWAELCINSILEKTTEGTYNLILVDNGSDKETQEWLMELAAHYDNIHVIRHEKNTGYVGGVNSGIEWARSMCKSQYIAVITSDTVCSTGWLENLTLHMQNEQVAMVGPVSNAVAGRQHVQYNNNKYDHEYVNALIGFFYIIRADVVDQLISLDGFYLDELFNYGSSDDLDLSARLVKMGYKLVIDRKTYVHHFLSKSLNALADQQDTSLDAMHGKFYDIFLKKHGVIKQSEPRILFGLPCVSEYMHYKFWMSSMSLNIPYAHAFEVVPRMSVEDARNTLVRTAVDNGFTHLLLLDDDHIYDDQDIIIKLVEANKDVIGVKAYTRKPPHFPCMFYKCNNSDFYQDVDFENVGIRELDAIGMAITLINVDIFRKMPEPWFEFKKVYVLGQGQSRFGEDVYFCDKAKALGYRIWVDTSIEVAHLGEPAIITSRSRKIE